MDIVEKLRIELASLPKGYISNKTIGGKVRHYLQWTENGKIKSRYIKDSEYEEIKAKVARRKELAGLCESMLRGDLEGARAVHHRFGTLFDLLFIENNPIPVKTALALMGLDHGAFRLPLCPMEGSHLAALESCLRELSLIL